MNGETERVLLAVDPATEEAFATLPLSSEADVAAALATAERALDETTEWQQPVRRAAALSELARQVEADAEELAKLECKDTGKPLSEARADVSATARYFSYYAGWADKLYGRSIPLGPDFVDYTLREPHGVCAQIIPWNYPLQVAARCVGPALACGNAVVLKPSELASVTPVRLAEMAASAGVPEGFFRVVVGAGDVGAALVGDPRVDHVTFVGSAKVGQLIAETCAKRFVPVELEMGGKSPNVVFADADLDRAVPVIVRSVTQNAGQSCSAGSRLLVDSSRYDEVVERVAKAFHALTIGPGESDPDLGPVVSEGQLTRAVGMIERAQREGARLVTGGTRADIHPGWYLEPTILDQASPDSEIFQEEVFGPVLVVAAFGDEEEAVRLANHSQYGLVAGVWTNDLGRAHRVARSIRAGQVYVNSYGVGGGESLPFGGYKRSGFARGKGEAAMLAYSQTKNVCVAL